MLYVFNWKFKGRKIFSGKCQDMLAGNSSPLRRNKFLAEAAELPTRSAFLVAAVDLQSLGVPISNWVLMLPISLGFLFVCFLEQRPEPWVEMALPWLSDSWFSRNAPGSAGEASWLS